jgi:N-methylhydantoinase B
MEILYGGIPGRPIGDGMDGHSWWPLFENIPTEYLEAYYPLRDRRLHDRSPDSGGAGLPPAAGNGRRRSATPTSSRARLEHDDAG